MTPCHDAAVDLGTAYVRVAARGRAALHEEPSVVRVSRDPLALRAVGASALEPAGPGPVTFLARPLRGGVVTDPEAAGWLVAAALRRARGLSLTRPSVLACIPSDATEEEAGLLRAALAQAEVRHATVVPEPLAAAVGAGLDLSSPHAQLVVDIGDGVTDVTVIRDGRIEVAGAVRMACSDLRWAIVRAVAEAHGVLLPPAEAQRVLEVLWGDEHADDAERVDVRGCRASDLAPAEARPTRSEIGAALERPLGEIVAAVRAVWHRLAPETSCDVIDSGLHLTGGGARLSYLTGRLKSATGLGVHVADDPTRAVIRGACRMAGLR
jgi:rod shape-determining protein MreB